MASPQPKLVLWVGPKHSGKTTAAGRLVARARRGGIAVAGLLAYSVYRGGELTGFDAVDLHTGVRCPLAGCDDGGAEQVGLFSFGDEGLAFGKAALESAVARSASLVVVDEFGPLELHGGGWRQAVDSLLAAAGGVILLVVREELTADVSRLYGRLHPQTLNALEPASIERVLDLLKNQ